MKKYYYSTANLAIYTEKEMNTSRFSRARFVELGEFRNREAAAFACKYDVAMSEKRI